MRSSTTEVYGAVASTDGDCFAAGRLTGNWYGGTSADAAAGQPTTAAQATVATPRQPRASHASVVRRPRLDPDIAPLSSKRPAGRPPRLRCRHLDYGKAKPLEPGLSTD